MKMKAIKSKLTKEKIKTGKLFESQRMMENHNQTSNISNNSLSKNNLIHAGRIRELQGQIDQAFVDAHRLRDANTKGI